GGCVTKDPETGVMNVGDYRGMNADKTQIPVLIRLALHTGHHVTARQHGGARAIPLADAPGAEPAADVAPRAPAPRAALRSGGRGAGGGGGRRSARRWGSRAAGGRTWLGCGSDSSVPRPRPRSC